MFAAALLLPCKILAFAWSSFWSRLITIPCLVIHPCADCLMFLNHHIVHGLRQSHGWLTNWSDGVGFEQRVPVRQDWPILTINQFRDWYEAFRVSFDDAR